MSMVFAASYSDRISLNISRDLARDAVRYTLESLGWTYENIDNDTFRAMASMTAVSWGERVRITLDTPGVLEIQSRCIYPLQFVDWGKNKQNVRLFISIFEAKALREGWITKDEPLHFDSSGKTPTERAFDDDDGNHRPVSK